MKGLLSTGASRAWLGVAFAGLAVVLLVLGLSLVPRLSAGQRVIDAAGPAFSDERVAGTTAGVDLISSYVDVADPLLTRRGGAGREVRSLIRLMRRKLGLSTAQARRILRREAPHVEALTRALPLDGVADEVPALTAYLAVILGTTEEQVGATLEQDFPRISQALTALRNASDAWYDVPGIDGLTRLSRSTPVGTVPGLRTYYRDDVVPLLAERREEFQDLAGSGGVGYIPYLLLAIGVLLLAFGVLKASAATTSRPGKLSWALVVGVGAVILLLVAGAQYFPRLGGAQRAIDDFEPVFEQERVRGAANGMDTVHEAIALGDPLMTASGGAAAEAPRLFRFLAARTGRSTNDVRRAIRRRAPKTTALLAAIPLTEVSAEIPHLVGYLSRALRTPGDRLVSTLRMRTPGLARALLTVPEVTVSWNAIPGTEAMTRFDGLTPVRTMAQLDDYLRQDLLPVLVAEREDFDTLASRWPPVDRFPPLLLIVGGVLALYGALMMRFVTRPT